MIKIENLNFGYSKKQLLFEKLNMEINKPGIVGLFGKNGAGKTTLLKLLSGLRFVNAGSMDVMGSNPSKRSPLLLQDLFFVPDQLDLPKMKAKEYVWYNGVGYPNFKHDLLYRLCDRFDLDTKLVLSSFSMGQQKKFMIAFALASACKLILLDEPTNGLDIPSKKVFRKVVAETLAEDQTIVISTHYVSEVEQIIDRFVVLDQQKIKFNGGMDDISEKFRFVTLPNLEQTEALYSEEEINGFKAILPNDGSKVTKIDLELFFNAIVSQKITLN